MKDSLNLLKELRDATGAGILDCKKYLKKANDNLEKAIKLMRSEEGIKADGKSNRVAAEGLIHFYCSSRSFSLHRPHLHARCRYFCLSPNTIKDSL